MVGRAVVQPGSTSTDAATCAGARVGADGMRLTWGLQSRSSSNSTAESIITWAVGSIGRGDDVTDHDFDLESDLPDLAAMTLLKIDELDESVLANSLRRLTKQADENVGTLSSFNAVI